MSIIKASTTTTTAFGITTDTTGTLVFQTGAVPTTAMTLGSDQSVTFAGAQTYTGAATFTSGITVQGLTLGKGAGAVATNTAVGASALAGSNSGTGQNTAVGYNALVANTTGSINSAFGAYSLAANTTGAYNSALGQGALYSNTTGVNNTALGYSALLSNTTAPQSTAVGYQALINATGGYNTAVGYAAAAGKTTGDSCTFIGRNTAGATHTGGACLFVGDSAGAAATSGSNNTFVGTNAGSSVTSGGKNSILGAYNGNQGGLDIRTASNYIVLSDGDGNPRGIFDGSGNFLVGTTSQLNSGKVGVVFNGAGTNGLTMQTTYGAAGSVYLSFYNSANTQAGYISQNGTTTVNYVTSSDARLKTNIVDASSAKAKIESIKIREFDWVSGEHQDFGVIAQELFEVAPEAVSVAQTEEQLWGVDYSKLVPSLIKYVQEQQNLITSLTARIEALED